MSYTGYVRVYSSTVVTRIVFTLVFAILFDRYRTQRTSELLHELSCRGTMSRPLSSSCEAKDYTRAEDTLPPKMTLCDNSHARAFQPKRVSA